MLTAEQQTFLSLYSTTRSSTNRVRISNNDHSGLIVSSINLLCKIIIVIGILITVFSNHWARYSNRYAGYKNRCSVHRCTSVTSDPTWLVDSICVLSIVNLLLESMNICTIVYFPSYSRKFDILPGLMLILSCIISDCGIVFGIYITLYVYQLPMGYAYYCFMYGVIFSIIDWALSLKRFISDWPDMINLNPEELAYYTKRAPENVRIVTLNQSSNDEPNV